MTSQRLFAVVACFLLLALIAAVRPALALPPLHGPLPEKSIPPDSASSFVVAGVAESLGTSAGRSSPPVSVSYTMAETFEGAWPVAGWELADNSTYDGGEFLWAKRDCHPHTGNFGGWSVGGGAQGSALDCSASYPNYTYTWALYGPFDLSSATSASLDYHYWGRTEGYSGCPFDYFFVGRSVNQQQFYGTRYCGNWTAGDDGNGYYLDTLNLNDFVGQPQVWVGFLLKSDSTVVYDGITIDDVSLHVSGGGPTDTPTPTATPSAPPASRFVYLPVFVREATATPTPTPTATPSATPPAPSRPIAFRSNRVDTNSEIYVMNSDGSEVTRLTDFDGYDFMPTWSPDGQRLAFYRSPADSTYADIFSMFADGTGVLRLTTARGIDIYPAWSPAGNRIAFGFLDFTTLNWDIYLMNTSGSDRVRLTSNSASDSEPTWSPDALHIAFRSDRDGNSEIYVMNADGSGQYRLTNHQASDLAPSWSPNGAKIAFVSDRDGNPEIYVMNSDGTGVTRLTNNPARDLEPTWSPDGAQIAFSTNRDGNYEIYMMNADGTGAVNLTNHPAGDSEPAWWQ
jgi:TolB protein